MATTTTETKYLDAYEARIANSEYKSLSYDELSAQIDYLEMTRHYVKEDIENWKTKVRAEIRKEDWHDVPRLSAFVEKYQLEAFRLEQILKAFYARGVELHEQGRVGA